MAETDNAASELMPREAAQAGRDGVVRSPIRDDSGRRGMASDLEKSGYQEGCPIATTALETAAQSDVLGAATRGAFQKWEAEIKRGLERFGMISEQADLVATTVLSQLEGALLLARTYRSLEPMHRAEQALKLLVKASK